MTPEERIKAFTDDFNTLITKYGVGLRPCLLIEGLGEVQLSSSDKKLGMKPVLVDDWEPPKADGKSTETDLTPSTNGHQKVTT